MTRKRYIKLMMAAGWSRNDAENTAGLRIDEFKPNVSSKTFDKRLWKKIMSHRGCWPYSTYVEAYDNTIDPLKWLRRRLNGHTLLISR